jgi:hypothetical protein
MVLRSGVLDVIGTSRVATVAEKVPVCGAWIPHFWSSCRYHTPTGTLGTENVPSAATATGHRE